MGVIPFSNFCWNGELEAHKGKSQTQLNDAFFYCRGNVSAEDVRELLLVGGRSKSKSD